MTRISHWHHLAEDFNTSSLDFYDQVEEAVKAREVPDCDFSRVTFKEGGLASTKREYLRIKRGRVAFDLCAAPYGSGFFFSYWVVRPGPRFPALWVLGLFAVVGCWFALILNGLKGALTSALVGGQAGGGSLPFAVLSLPFILWFIAWTIHDGVLFDIEEEEILTIPIVGFIYRLFFNPNTYYSLDTALMFQESVGRAVGEVINSILSEQGLRALSSEKLKPTIRDLAA